MSTNSSEIFNNATSLVTVTAGEPISTYAIEVTITEGRSATTATVTNSQYSPAIINTVTISLGGNTITGTTGSSTLFATNNFTVFGGFGGCLALNNIIYASCATRTASNSTSSTYTIRRSTATARLPSNTSVNTGLDSSSKVGIGVGTGCAGLILVIILPYILFQRRRRRARVLKQAESQRLKPELDGKEKPRTLDPAELMGNAGRAELGDGEERSTTLNEDSRVIQSESKTNTDKEVVHEMAS